ncbi:TadE family type IV pilus minor pilin [Janibacter sp. G56]|uniref:TadE family type IV pilus minor pilin n=1 Tax=Janibacter sp. G56 TaxID=3418717 RepID=UPI003CFBDCA8
MPGRSRARVGERPESGAATAEFAVAVPAVVFVLVVALSGIRLGLDQIRCLDAARSSVRMLARGDAEGEALRVARRAAPDGASVRVAREGGTVAVEVTAAAPSALRLIGLSGEPRGSATAVLEGVPDGAVEGGGEGAVDAGQG